MSDEIRIERTPIRYHGLDGGEIDRERVRVTWPDGRTARLESATAETLFYRTAQGGTTDGSVEYPSIRAGSTGVNGKTVAGGSARGSNERILARGTRYMIRATTYADSWVVLRARWYEETPKVDPY